VKDFKGNYPKYVYYFLQTFHLENFNSGAGVPTLNQNHLHKLQIKIPPLPIQRKIAAVLSAYDDLIENNNRRIAILEKMAEELYREWFVRLRFPGHEKTKIVKGMPEGWEDATVGNAFQFLGGGTPSTTVSSYWKDGEINWYSPTDLTSSNAMFSLRSKVQISDLGLKESSARLFPPYSVMMTSRATIGQISINTTPACTNQGFIICIPNDRISLHFLYHWLKSNKETFILLSNGATFLELAKGKFKNIRIVIPPEGLMRKFSEIQRPLFISIEMILRQQGLLTSTRDRLLTRLMSGKIDVEDLDIQFPPSMALPDEAGNEAIKYS
jgi:type I restriction enzyme, S subunit